MNRWKHEPCRHPTMVYDEGLLDPGAGDQALNDLVKEIEISVNSSWANIKLMVKERT